MNGVQPQVQSRFAKVHLPAGGNSSNVGETFACRGLTCKLSEKIKKANSFFPSWLACIAAPFRRLWRLVVRRSENQNKMTAGEIKAEAASYRREYFQNICVDAIRRYARIANAESMESVAEDRFEELLEHITANFEVDFEKQFVELLNKNPSEPISAALYDAYALVKYRSDIHKFEFEVLSDALKTYVGPEIEAYIAGVSGIFRQDSVRLNINLLAGSGSSRTVSRRPNQ